ncbi:MAG TPA: ABC transporter substrate-binding protein [Pseudonocardiaceae bacterium]|nr:ABC transporter substrate-binding protein [Pseudonocardiaceae bacterium]
MRKAHARWRRVATLVAALTVAAAGIAGCSGGSSASGSGVILTVAGGPSGPIQRIFNPYLPTNAFTQVGSDTYVYETLAAQNTLKPDDWVPWLATSWAWSNGNKTFTMQIRKNVKWTDGTPFTAADVVYSFDLMKKYPALNLRGVEFQSITANADNSVTMTFAQAYAQKVDVILNQEIVPQHIWSKIADPTSWANPNPVGTGPLMLSDFSSQSYLLVKNPNYWQPGKPAIGGMRFVSERDNTAVALALAQGQLDWAGVFIPNAQASYTSKSPNNHIFWPTVGTDGLITNQQSAPFNDLAVRKAVSLGVDRNQIANANQGVPATSVTGLPMPLYADAIAPDLKGVNFKQDTAQAKQILEQDGYRMDGNGYYARNGQELSFAITDPSSYTEQIAEAQVIVSQMKAIGIKVTINGVTTESINTLTGKGNFQASLGYPIATQTTEFDIYDTWMNPVYSAPIGTLIPTYQNIERWTDPQTAQEFNSYPSVTDPAQQQQILYKFQHTMADDLPIIPFTYFADYTEYSTAKVTGWPTAQNPYATCNPGGPGSVLVVVNLKPVGG